MTTLATTTGTTTHTAAHRAATSPAVAVPTSSAATTRRLLVCGAAGLPVWSVVALTQAATRGGFDLTRHPLSALSTGPLGWLQITNFILAGILTALGALGLRRARPDAPWPARLTSVAGIALIAAGGLVMDPPPGFNAPDDLVVTTMSWHSIGHMVAGSILFAALIAACVVIGRRYTREGQRTLGVLSHLAGAALLLGDAWAIAGGTAGSLTLAVGGITAMLWLSGHTAGLARRR